MEVGRRRWRTKNRESSKRTARETEEDQQRSGPISRCGLSDGTTDRPTHRADGKKISGAQKGNNEERTEENEREEEEEEEEKVATKSVVTDYNAVKREERRGCCTCYHF